MKKEFRNTLLLSALLAGTSLTVQAQEVTIGARLGLNAAKVSLDAKDADDEKEFKPKMIFGPQLGVTLNAQFGSLSIQPSLLFTQKGFKIAESAEEMGGKFSYKSTTRLSYLELPINLVYTIGGEEGFQVFAGPYVGFGLKGKNKYEAEFTFQGQTDSDKGEEDIYFSNKDKDDAKPYLRAMDYGLNAGLGYKAGPIQAQLGYGLGLANMIPNSASDQKPDDKLYNRGISLSVAYFFGGGGSSRRR